MEQVVIIGAGLGGLATALRLRQQGFQVTVLAREVILMSAILHPGAKLLLFPLLPEVVGKVAEQCDNRGPYEYPDVQNICLSMLNISHLR